MKTDHFDFLGVADLICELLQNNSKLCTLPSFLEYSLLQ